jgi:hypothetical protein
MADNTQLPLPSTVGDVIAADDISGVKYQRVKLIHGADGVNDGDVSSANPLPVAETPRQTLTAVSGAYTYIGKAAPDAAAGDAEWQISRLDESTADIAVKFADGVSTFTKVWNNRATYTY